MTSKKEFELRMYGLVIYQLSGIQQGIQFDHAKDEYAEKYGKNKEYLEYRKKHKTVIVLNGGTTNDGKRSYYGVPKQTGTMEQHLETLRKNKIKCAPFYEPDLNYALTSIAFLVDERVFNKKEYPDFEIKLEEYEMAALETSRSLKKFKDVPLKELIIISQQHKYKEYVKKVGKDIAFLKEFLKQFRFA